MKNIGKTILFVEDNPLVLTIYRNWLQREGFQVESAGDGLVAIEKLPQLKPNLVILDLMLPKLNGMDVLKFIREHDELKETPVMILSNAYMDERTSKTLTTGTNRRLLKTQCTPAKLIQTVRELMGTTQPESSQPHIKSMLAEANEALLQETRVDLLKDAPNEIVKIREHCLGFVKLAGSADCTEPLNNLYQRVRLLCARAGLGDCTKIAHLASALEAMLFEIIFKKSKPSASALQTIAQSVDCLGRLFQTEDVQSTESMFKAKVLIVDDDPVCTFATVAAMKRAKLEAVSTQDPVAALDLAQQDHYDIVLLDINMPGLNGFEVCEKLRLLSDYQKTPVIFVTSNSEFQNRAQAVLSGGNDLISKPISPLELALKTIMHLIEPREQSSAAAKPKAEIKMAPTVAPIISKAVPTTAEEIESHANNLFADETNEVPTMLTPAVDKSKTEAPIISAAPRNAPPIKLEAPDAKIPAPFIAEQPPVKRANPSQSNSNQNAFMKNSNQNNQPFDKLVNEVARILFGEESPAEMPLRLTRIALERYNVPEIINAVPPTNGRSNGVNGSKLSAADEPFERITTEVARVIFGDDSISEMHLRLTRIALERYNVPQIISAPAETNGRNGSHANYIPSISISL